jgi:hypothetical protein
LRRPEERALRRRWRWLGLGGGAAVVSALVAAVLYRDAFFYFPLVDRFTGGDYDPYMVKVSRRPRHWRLRPGFSFTVQQAIDDRVRQGRDLSVEHLTARYRPLGYELGDVIFKINQQGFKGPEIDPAHARPRVLMLGDSCTFGSLFDRYTYPRVAEATLREHGRDVEVVNAGVEGYDAGNLRLELPTYAALSPEIVTIYVGWNAIYTDSTNVVPAPAADVLDFSARLRIAQERLVLLLFGPRRFALWQYYKKRVPDAQDAMLARLASYRPAYLDDVVEVAEAFRARHARVAVMTLPGLYTMDEAPTELALTKGHLPPYTRNPYVVAKVTERYNEGLREAARRNGYTLIDLDQWSRTALVPRDASFVDNVHLTEEYQQQMGQYVATILQDLR